MASMGFRISTTGVTRRCWRRRCRAIVDCLGAIARIDDIYRAFWIEYAKLMGITWARAIVYAPEQPKYGYGNNRQHTTYHVAVTVSVMSIV